MTRTRSRAVIITVTLLGLIGLHLLYRARPSSEQSRLLQIPLQDRLGHVRGQGGSWHIPQSWLVEDGSSLPADASILDAANLVTDLVLRHNRFLNNTAIPLLIHQTLPSSDMTRWPDATRATVASWSPVINGEAAGPEMAWFLWDDDGIEMLLWNFEVDLVDRVLSLPYPVQRADVLRIVAVKWFGGVYVDADTTPLKHPDRWVNSNDILDWTPTIDSSKQNETTSMHDETHPVSAIFGIEADNPADPDSTYWRMGYRWPVQLTNWAFAMAPHHPVADEFLDGLSKRMNENNLTAMNPLDTTGPPVVTAAVRNVALRSDPLFVWDSLSGRNGDAKGGRSKLIAGDVIILPITGFSPGRGWFQNMGSESVEHPNACLLHKATGSWKKLDFKVTSGKLCRLLFASCRDWADIQAPI